MKGVAAALLAAALFGLSTPLAKQVSPLVEPVLLAGLLYLGSGLGLGAYSLIRRVRPKSGAREAALTRADAPCLAGAIVSGGVLGPLLLMWGLAQTPAASASLLLNLEGVFTALLAWFVFKETFDARIARGMALIPAGGVCLSWMGRPEAGVPWGTLAIAGACLAWAVDHNLTRNVSAGDPVEIAMLIGLVGEVPVGAVLVQGDAILAVAANRPIAGHDPTAHAEIEALRAGGKTLSSYRLSGTTLYVTLEPCVMCASAIVHARVARLVFGAWDSKAGAAGSTTNVFTMPSMNHRVDVFGGVLMEESARMLSAFFAARRRELT